MNDQSVFCNRGSFDKGRAITDQNLSRCKRDSVDKGPVDRDQAFNSCSRSSFDKGSFSNDDETLYSCKRGSFDKGINLNGTTAVSCCNRGSFDKDSFSSTCHSFSNGKRGSFDKGTNTDETFGSCIRKSLDTEGSGVVNCEIVREQTSFDQEYNQTLERCEENNHGQDINQSEYSKVGQLNIIRSASDHMSSTCEHPSFDLHHSVDQTEILLGDEDEEICDCDGKVDHAHVPTLYMQQNPICQDVMFEGHHTTKRLSKQSTLPLLIEDPELEDSESEEDVSESDMWLLQEGQV